MLKTPTTPNASKVMNGYQPEYARYHKKAIHEELIRLLPHQWKLQHPKSVLTKQAAESGN